MELNGNPRAPLVSDDHVEEVIPAYVSLAANVNAQLHICQLVYTQLYARPAEMAFICDLRRGANIRGLDFWPSAA
jgi:hypothetical protein